MHVNDTDSRQIKYISIKNLVLHNNSFVVKPMYKWSLISEIVRWDWDIRKSHWQSQETSAKGDHLHGV